MTGWNNARDATKALLEVRTVLKPDAFSNCEKPPMDRQIDPEGRTSSPLSLPSEVQKLRPRMRQIAEFVYLNGFATVNEVQNSIDNAPSIYAVRTMLIRLTRKGILESRKSGRHMSMLYYPAIRSGPVKELAIRGFLARNFNGSAPAALEALLQMASSAGVAKDHR